jgi:hypothetical protein
MKKYVYQKKSVSQNDPKEVFEIMRKNYRYDENTGVITNINTGKVYDKLTKKLYLTKISMRYNNIEYLIMPHRLVYFLNTNDFPNDNEVIDHINGIRNDNRPINLRKATTYQNQQNAVKRTNKQYSSKFKGVGVEKYPTYINYAVTIQINHKKYKICRVKNEELAAKIYDSAARFYHKEFASCNFTEIFIKPKSVEELRLLKQTEFKCN